MYFVYFCGYLLFPSGTSELFATCSEEDIRVWHIDKPKELLRITVPNMTCNALDFMSDGHSIISGVNQWLIWFRSQRCCCIANFFFVDKWLLKIDFTLFQHGMTGRFESSHQRVVASCLSFTMRTTWV